MSYRDENADYRYVAEDVPYEKFYGYRRDYTRRFPGCSYSTGHRRTGGQGACLGEERYICYRLGRECDPDLCREYSV